MEESTEQRFRDVIKSLKLIAWMGEGGMHVGRIPDVCLLTIMPDHTFGRFKIIRKGKTQAGLGFDDCVVEIEGIRR